MASSREQSYVLAGNDKFRTAISARSVDGPFASFFLPFLEPGMRVLDAGCGPGSITLGIARRVAPGEVIGIDMDEPALDAGRLNGLTDNVDNVRFESGDVYDLQFPDASFDRVFVSSLLEHLKEPERALRELFRVLKPGGVAGIGATAGAGYVYPPTPDIDEILDYSMRALRLAGGDPAIGQRLRGLLLEAGFERVDAGASGVSNGTDEQISRAAEALINRSFGDKMLQLMREQGWLDDTRIAAMKNSIAAWGKHPHAVAVTMYGTAIAYKA